MLNFDLADTVAGQQIFEEGIMKSASTALCKFIPPLDTFRNRVFRKNPVSLSPEIR